MHILGIETSCDETAAAVVKSGRHILSNIIASSRDAFERSGGVIPEQAARRQLESVLPVIQQAMETANMQWGDLDAIAVTRGPGLLGSLLVGTTAARTIALLHSLPLIGVHHTLGHLSSTWLCTEDTPTEDPHFPLLTLSASGGHTDLWLRRSHTRGELLGRTRDDAAGEAFDKGASLLGLPYPGGPSISREGEKGNPDAYIFPRPLHDEPTLDFSFSGLKTSLKYLLRDTGDSLTDPGVRRDVAASYEYALCRHLVDRVCRALIQHKDIREVHVVGGVSANVRLRSLLTAACPSQAVRAPASLRLCTDNAAMIAAAGQFLVDECGDGAFASFETEAAVALDAFVERGERGSKNDTR